MFLLICFLLLGVIVMFSSILTKSTCDDISFKLRKEQLEKEKAETKSAISSIDSKTSNDSTLDSCISGISCVFKYLSHCLEAVKTYAAKVICFLVHKAALLLCRESDPRKLLKYGKILLDIIERFSEALKDNKINLDPVSKDCLKFAKQLIEKTQELGYEQLDKDRFVKLGEKRRDNLFKDFTFDLFQSYKPKHA